MVPPATGIAPVAFGGRGTAQKQNNLTMALIIGEIQRLQGERRVRQYWVRPWIERRRLFGQYHTLFQQFERESHGDYQPYIRMDPNTFAELLLMVFPQETQRTQLLLHTIQ